MDSQESGMTANQILLELQSLGSESYKKLLMKNHGVKEPFFGIKIGDLKKIQKRINKDYQLALDLYATGNYDAMYLAGLIMDDSMMTEQDLQKWVQNAYGGALPGSTVPWVAAGSPHGWSLSLDWIDSSIPHIAEAGWNTLANIVALKEDSTLDLQALESLLDRCVHGIHQAPDHVRYAMNQFIISVGCCVLPLTNKARETADIIGTVTADLGENSCQIPSANKVIRKAEASGKLGQKRKTVKR
ncbi:MAG: DNA alkylation repair protein [Verrucomicrobiales bacterium]